MQFDLMEIRPCGEDGQTHILTCVCVCTRYPFFRNATGRVSSHIAELMLDIILDAGVVPKILQSDSEFCSLAFEELCMMLGSNQLFSTALRPQSLAIGERQHLDMRNSLAILVESWCRAAPRKWPRFTRWLESRLRHKTLPSGASPYSLVHGFSGVSQLQSAVQALQEIPASMIHQEWLRSIVEESQTLAFATSEIFEKAAAAAEAKAAEVSRRCDINRGDLVLLRKPFFEKGTGMILPQADGPYVVDRVHDNFSCRLTDPLTGEAIMQGRRVNIDRLVRFKFPPEWVQVDLQEDSENTELSYQVGDFVVYKRPSGRLHVGCITRSFSVGQQLEVSAYEVPARERFGPWSRRPWTPLEASGGGPQLDIISVVDVVLKAALQERALSQRTLEQLLAAGIPLPEVKSSSILPT